MRSIAEILVSISPVPAVLPHCSFVTLAEEEVLSNKVAAYTAYYAVFFPTALFLIVIKTVVFQLTQVRL